MLEATKYEQKQKNVLCFYTGRRDKYWKQVNINISKMMCFVLHRQAGWITEANVNKELHRVSAVQLVNLLLNVPVNIPQLVFPEHRFGNCSPQFRVLVQKGWEHFGVVHQLKGSCMGLKSRWKFDQFTFLLCAEKSASGFKFTWMKIIKATVYKPKCMFSPRICRWDIHKRTKWLHRL